MYVHLQEGSVEIPIFIRVGSRHKLQMRTNDATENIIIRFTFLRQESSSPQSIGIGKIKIIRLWRILRPAWTKTTANTLIHFTGASLNIQFVHIPCIGFWKQLAKRNFANELTYTSDCNANQKREVRNHNKSHHDIDNHRVSLGSKYLQEEKKQRQFSQSYSDYIKHGCDPKKLSQI